MSNYLLPAVSNNIGLGINVFKTGNVTGIFNVGIGGNILMNNSVGIYNTAIGSNVFTSSISGNNNCAVGSNSGNGILGSNNTMLGSNTGQAPGDTNIYNNSCAIGYGATVNANGQIVIGSATETVKIPSTIVSTGPTVGGLVVAGGINVAGTLNVTGGSNIYMNGFLVGTSTNGTVITNFGTNSLTAGAISANNLNISTNALTSGNMAVGSINSGYINMGTLTAGNISVGNIVCGATSLATSSVGIVTVGNISVGNLTSGNLYAGAITAGSLNLGVGNLTAGNISSGTIIGGASTLISLSVGSLTTGGLSTGTMTGGNMFVGNMTAGSISAGTNSLTVGNMSIGTVTSGGIVTTSVSSGTITVGAISLVNLVSGTVSCGTITSGTHAMSTNPLTCGNMYVGSITGSSISTVTMSSGTVTSGSITAYSITSSAISAGAIAWSSLNMSTNPLTAGNLTVGTIIASTINMANNSLSAGNVSAGTIYGTSLNANNNPITAGGIAVGSIVSGTMNMGTNSLVCGNMSVGAIITGSVGLSTNPQYTVDVVGTVNATSYNNLTVTIGYNGSTSSLPGISAKYIQQTFGQFNDGVYWINLPSVGATQIYCIMNPAYAGGGWMMAVKASRGTAFGYTSSYWYTNNTTNVAGTDRSNSDAKFQTYNYFPATDWMAIFPDTGINGGDLPASLNTGWVWVENNAVGITVPLLHWYSLNQSNYCKSSNGIGGFSATNPTPTNLAKFANAGVSNVWSAQGGFQWYGMNYVGLTLGYLTSTGISTVTTGTSNANSAVRWGFGWNNENDQGSNDCCGGIGLGFGGWSAGDRTGAQTITGLNSQFRFEWYVR